jgi:hypothetical protein
MKTMKPAGLTTPSRTRRRLARRGRRAPARGFIIGYLTLALLVFGILTVSLGRLRDTQASAEWVDRTQATLRSHIQTIRARMLVCAANMFIDNEPLLSALPSSGSGPEGVTLEGLPCTGESSGSFVMSGDGSPPGGMFDGSSAVFVPRLPDAFEPWRYVNEVKAGIGTNIFIRTATTDPNAISAINRVVKAFRSPEVESSVVGGKTLLTFYLKRPAAAEGA